MALEHNDAQQRLASDVYRRASIGELEPHERQGWQDPLGESRRGSLNGYDMVESSSP